MSLNQGNEANRSGQFLEQIIEDEFRRGGVDVFSYADKGDNGDIFATQFLLRNVPYTSIFGCQSRSEFVYRNFALDVDIRIECRWQQVPGSVDEKLPYMYMNALQAMPEHEIWLVIEGGGARDDAINWLKNVCAQVWSKRIRILTIPEVRRRIRELTRGGR